MNSVATLLCTHVQSNAKNLFEMPLILMLSGTPPLKGRVCKKSSFLSPYSSSSSTDTLGSQVMSATILKLWVRRGCWLRRDLRDSDCRLSLAARCAARPCCWSLCWYFTVWVKVHLWYTAIKCSCSNKQLKTFLFIFYAAKLKKKKKKKCLAVFSNHLSLQHAT